MMDIHVNGDRKQVSDGTSVGELVRQLHLPDDQIAVELDREVVRRADWESTTMTAGAQVEIVRFVGGG